MLSCTTILLHYYQFIIIYVLYYFCILGPIPFTKRLRGYAEKVSAAYKFASNLLLEIIMGTDNDLLERLKSLKQFFLMDQSDFFVDYCDIAGTCSPRINSRCTTVYLPCICCVFAVECCVFAVYLPCI